MRIIVRANRVRVNTKKDHRKMRGTGKNTISYNSGTLVQLFPTGGESVEEDAVKLEARQVFVEYQMRRSQQRILALQDICFKVDPGRLISVLGPSGCGKTTLLNVIAGLQPTTHGDVLL